MLLKAPPISSPLRLIFAGINILIDIDFLKILLVKLLSILFVKIIINIIIS